ncbi:MAG: hypothetical protein F6K50_32270 [Moorea sp. SIO3I7]|nr:hypothetical protein [Moorena sp. SIO3I7]
MQERFSNQSHSTGWGIQSWASFVISIFAMGIGIANLPADNWIKGYLGIGLVFSVGSSINIAKTTRDIHESKKLTSKVEEARVEKLLTDHNSLH